MSFIAKRCSLSASQLLVASSGKVFPLLCPTREYEWIQNWKCDLVFSESGLAELDCIFATHFPGDEKDIWVVDCYQPTEMIQFIRVAENRVIRYRISLKDNAHGQTIALWEQIVTGLTETGNRYVESLSNLEFGIKIKELENMINYYLETGEMLIATK